MKNLFKKCAMLLLFLIANVVTANVTFDNILLYSESSKSLNLHLTNNDGAAEIFIKDTEGVLLYSEQFNGSKFSKKFDVSLLPDGIYSMEVVGQTKINVLPFKVSGIKVKVLEENKTMVHKPIVRIKNNLLFVSKFSPNKGLLKIEIYDANDNLLHEEKLNKSIITERVFDISQLPFGNYMVVAKYDRNRKLIKEISY